MCLQSCAQTALKDCDSIFASLISSMQKRHSEVKQLITAQEKTAAEQSAWIRLKLEEEIRKLRKRDAELGQLTRADDHIHLIKVPDAFLCCLMNKF